MAFTPAAPLPINYSQGLPYPDIPVSFAVDAQLSNITNLQILGVPEWLTILNLLYSSSTQTITFSVRVNAAHADGMQEGNYEADIRLRFRANVSITTATITSDPYRVFIEINATTFLALNPTVLPFNYIIGGNLPQNQTLNITSGGSWNITAFQSWVTLSQTNGVGSSSLSVGVNTVGLTAGIYESILQVNDSLGTPRQATVTLVVTAGDTENTYLYVSPENLQFISEQGVDNTTQKTVTIEASDAWSVTSSQAWCVLSVSSGSSGLSSITVTVDSDELTNINLPYLAELVFTSEGIQKTVFVELIIIPFLLQGITSETHYFANDRNKLEVTNVFPNMQLYCEAIAGNGVENVVYKLNAPYQNGLAKQLIGMETNVLLKHVIPTNNFTTRVKHNIDPVNINLNAFNKAVFTGATTPLANYSNLKFLTGKTPEIANKLCYTPATINVTKDAIISLSALNATEAPTDIVISGDVTQTISATIANNLLTYNAIINLSLLSLQAGNQITIAWSGITITVNIKDNPVEQTIIAFENEWREFEFFECTGFLTITPKIDQIKTEIQVEGAEHTKIVSIDKGASYTLNTGYIYSKAEFEWLAKILYAERVYIYVDGQPVEIILDSKSLTTYKTREHFRSYNLKFTKAIIND
ncbi:BACON domain-containing protein [Winogradskyella sp.]|uniref:BACON domain-containing protein n=1 Tax=Winogradskyella sp. TaxID=1883156 RepID=UPI003BAC4680